eukprot:c8661_g1_i2.p1 GENE.c8661_g1_i2~~c8661_g1_i2.p1  ORF type:complete len:229 (+),score=33.90 c8661_g1_i2:201-887(+)
MIDVGPGRKQMRLCSVTRATQFGLFVRSVASSAKPSPPPPSSTMPSSPFFHPVLPDISIENYAHRIGRFMRCSDESLLLATSYILKLQEGAHPAISQSTAHRVMIACVTVATKFIDEFNMSNLYYAAVGGVRLEELNSLELETLRRLKWNAFVRLSDYSTAAQALDPPRYPVAEARLWWGTIRNRLAGHMLFINPAIMSALPSYSKEDWSSMTDDDNCEPVIQVIDFF